MKPLLHTKRGTCIRGLVICIDNLTRIMDEFVLRKKTLKYFATYKITQDHGELLRYDSDSGITTTQTLFSWK